MSPLIPFEQRPVGSHIIPTVNGRHIHDYLAIGRPYASWVKLQIKRGRLIEGQDYVFSTEGKNPQGGRPSEEYHFTFEATKCIGMLSATPKGDEVRQYFLECERQLLAQQPPALPVIHDPAMKLVVDLALKLDESRHHLACIEAEQVVQREALIVSQQRIIEALTASQRAEDKADMALDEARRMTLEEFILSNGLIRLFPYPKHAEYARWLGTFCVTYGQHVGKAPVLGKPWDNENAYPLQALAAWLRYEQKKPQQIGLAALWQNGNTP